MKLSESQIQRIENYLDRKELFQLDVRGEVLDHIIAGIEKAIQEEEIDFESAFAIEKGKWHRDLSGYSSSWIGWVWNGPKIVIKKCESWIKKTYLISFICVLCIGLPIYFWIDGLTEAIVRVINMVIGIGYYGFILWCIWAYYRMKKGAFKTTYLYLFGVQSVGALFLYLMFNPLFSLKGYDLMLTGRFSPTLFIHIFLFVNAYRVYGLYKMYLKFSKKFVV
ncbi:hypothetical protein [Cytophaga sp. FL35]|uniref:hypothetical protein n=1 Tax=Cytophaga sp. FL35 TaxID=1904456 RepID=UPI0016534547|nr:hypothetical protein [Cytophaga sp. FL35]MBC6997526.1 hypothetical protein [Cytophaga sp. FL35]